MLAMYLVFGIFLCLYLVKPVCDAAAFLERRHDRRVLRLSVREMVPTLDDDALSALLREVDMAVALTELNRHPHLRRRAQAVAALRARSWGWIPGPLAAQLDPELVTITNLYVTVSMALPSHQRPEPEIGVVDILELFGDPALLESFTSLADGWSGTVPELMDVSRAFA